MSCVFYQRNVAHNSKTLFRTRVHSSNLSCFHRICHASRSNFIVLSSTFGYASFIESVILHPSLVNSSFSRVCHFFLHPKKSLDGSCFLLKFIIIQMHQNQMLLAYGFHRVLSYFIEFCHVLHSSLSWRHRICYGLHRVCHNTFFFKVSALSMLFHRGFNYAFNQMLSCFFHPSSFILSCFIESAILHRVYPCLTDVSYHAFIESIILHRVLSYHAFIESIILHRVSLFMHALYSSLLCFIEFCHAFIRACHSSSSLSMPNGCYHAFIESIILHRVLSYHAFHRVYHSSSSFILSCFIESAILHRVYPCPTDVIMLSSSLSFFIEFLYLCMRFIRVCYASSSFVMLSFEPAILHRVYLCLTDVIMLSSSLSFFIEFYLIMLHRVCHSSSSFIHA